MKGPYERLKYDMRRVWECPVCHHRTRSSGESVTSLCNCQKEVPGPKQVWMKLLEDGIRRVPESSSQQAS